MRSTPSPRSRRVGLLALLLACAALVAGCGSTASRAARRRAQQAAGGLEGLSGPDTGTAASGPAASSDSGSAAAASGAIGGPSSGRSGAAARGAGSAGAAAAAAQAGAPVQIGILTDNSQTTNTFLGSVSPGLKQGDNAAGMQAVSRYINSHGGLAGHPIQPVVHLFNFTGGSSYASEYQKACADFTQDHHVVAVVGSFLPIGWENFATCLSQAKVPWITETAPTMLDQQDFDRFAPYLYAPDALGGDRWGVVVDQIAAAGYFSPAAKVGIYYTDEPVAQRTVAVVKARLAQIGHPSVAEGSAPAQQSTADLSQKGAPTQADILKFRQAGVDHVIAVDGLGSSFVFFMTEAEQQGYRPRYALTSMETIGLGTHVAPHAQLQGALASSWLPPYDVNQAQMPGLNPAFQLCMELTKGITAASNGPQSLALGCNGLFFLQTAANRAGSLNPSAIRSAVDGLGSAFASPMVWTTQFGPGRSDGASSVGLLAWNTGCNCFAYQGAPTPAP